MRVLSGIALLFLLTGCAGPGATQIQAAPSASDAGCAALLNRLPATLLGRKLGTTDAAGAAVWGDPAIVLRCGVEPPGPSADACVTVNNVDWLFRENTSAYLFTTYGRTPATELAVPHQVDRTQASGALAQLTAAITPVPASRHCVGAGDD